MNDTVLESMRLYVFLIKDSMSRHLLSYKNLATKMRSAKIEAMPAIRNRLESVNITIGFFRPNMYFTILVHLCIRY